MVIRRIDVLSAMKIGAAIGVGIGLLAGICFFLFGILAGGLAAMGGQSGSSGAFGMLGGVLGGGVALVMFPIFYGVAAGLGSALQALIYNLAAKYVGGIRFEAE